MSSIGITVYALRVQNNQNNNSYDLNNINGMALLDLFSQFLNQHSPNILRVNSLNKAFQVEHYARHAHILSSGAITHNFILGKIKSGEYGIASDIVDTHTGTVTYHKGVNDADILPFHFGLAIPTGNIERGILILQNIGVHSVKQIFERLFANYLRNINKEYELVIGTLSPIQYVDRFLNQGAIKEVRFIRYQIPQDTANRLQVNNGISFDEYVVHNIGRESRIERGIRNFIFERGRIANIVEIQDFDYDNVKVEVQVGKKKKVLDLNNLDRIIINQDITDQVAIIEGLPTDISMEALLTESLLEYLVYAGFLLEGE